MLTQQLRESTATRRLRLKCTKGGELLLLCEFLKVSTVLTHLDLSWNLLGVEGAMALAEALRVNRGLTHLDLRWNEIGDEGAMALAGALRVNHTLARLNLSDNYIAQEGAQAVTKALEDNRVITHLDMRWNCTGSIKALAEALWSNPKLATIAWGYKLNYIMEVGLVSELLHDW